MMFAKKCNKLVLALVLTLTIITAMLSSTGAVAFAQDNETAYSDVLDDLHKDSTFDESNYPVKEKDYSLSVIQLAEGVNKELFIYVYQPSGIQEMHASSINISTQPKTDIQPDNYNLKFINSKGVFFKYSVEGITVSDSAMRYYAIISIFRPFNKDYNDEEPGHDNKVTEVPFPISKQYEFGSINGNPFVRVYDIDTIEIINKFVGHVRYKDGFTLFSKGACDSHFVAFNTDKPIDKLCEATVKWESQSFYHKIDGRDSGVTFDKMETPKRVLSEDDETVHYKGQGIFGGTYSWDRIETVEDFINGVEDWTTVYHGAFIDKKISTPITEDAKNALKENKWVLRFAETEYEYKYTQDMVGTTVVERYHCERGTMVGNVTILQLKFITDGVTYNLGVIDNKQTGSDKPINPDTETKVTVSNGLKSFWNNFLEALKWIGVVIGVIIGLVLLYFIIRFVLKLTAPLREKAKERRIEKRLEKKQSDKKERESHGKKKAIHKR